MGALLPGRKEADHVEADGSTFVDPVLGAFSSAASMDDQFLGRSENQQAHVPATLTGSRC